jgi:hypothetical protein
VLVLYEAAEFGQLMHKIEDLLLDINARYSDAYVPFGVLFSDVLLSFQFKFE